MPWLSKPFLQRWLCLTMLLLLGGRESALGADENEGWQSLFNGKDLSGWQGSPGKKPEDGWVVEEGALVRKGRGGDLWTAKPYGDFVLELEFLTEGNSGILFRKPNPEKVAKDRLEIQILTPAPKGPTKHTCGSLYDCLAASKDLCRKDEWNQLRLTSANNRVQVELNGEQVLDANLEEWTDAGKNPDGSKNKFGKPLKDFARQGYIGLQDHGKEVHYRNLRIKPLEGK